MAKTESSPDHDSVIGVNVVAPEMDAKALARMPSERAMAWARGA